MRFAEVDGGGNFSNIKRFVGNVHVNIAERCIHALSLDGRQIHCAVRGLQKIGICRIQKRHAVLPDGGLLQAPDLPHASEELL